MQSADLTKQKETAMQKIIRAALQGRFQGTNLDNLIKVIEATPNPAMATELLLDVWEEPVLLPYWSSKSNDGSIANRTMTGVDHWRGVVSFVREVAETEIKYFPKGTTRAQAKEMVGKDESSEIGKDYEYFYIPTGKMKTDRDSCTISQWIANHCETI